DLTKGKRWNGWGVDLANRRFQPAEMAGLRPEDVPALKLSWAFAFPGETRTVGQPTVVGARVFVGTYTGKVYSIDAKTGCLYWVFDTGNSVRTAITIYKIDESPSPLYAATFASSEGVAFAVNADSGEQLWRTPIETHSHTRLSGAPQVYRGRIYVPVATNESIAAASADYQCCNNRGSVSALDAKTGEIIWKQYTIKEEPAPLVKNQAGTQLWGPSGAGVWSAVTIDTQKNLLYVGTGDNSSDPPSKTSDAVIAMDLDTGETRWVYQATANDAYNMSCESREAINCPDSRGEDLDFGSSPILVSRENGQRILLAGQKSGVLHALDPDANGKVLWQVRMGRGGVAGGIIWGPAVDEENIYVALADFKPEQIKQKDGSTMWLFDPEEGGGLFAYRIRDGKLLWHVPPVSCKGRTGCSPAQSAAVTVIPGVVFSGAFDGIMRAYSTKDGKLIWQYDTVRNYQTTNNVEGKGGAIDGPGPTVVDGMLYVNSGYGRLNGEPGNVLLAFEARSK
ncbi:MAG: polyvinyl alcohol dehydrogenase (cytochrome), partial [Planctomycetota bacterium]